MRVLITGGTGFIGSRLALRCLADGERVRVLAAMNTAIEQANGAAIERYGGEVLAGSVTDEDHLARVVRGVDVIHHLAAAQHEAGASDAHFHHVNVEGTRRLLAAAEAARVGRIVHGGTIGIWGAGSAGIIDDDTAPSPDNVYGATKLEAERLVLGAGERLPVTVVRISEAYGPGDMRLLKLFRAVQEGLFTTIGDGSNLHQPIFVDDLVDALRLAARREEALYRAWIAAGPDVVSTTQMVEAAAMALGANRPRLRLPMWPFVAGAWALEAALPPFGITPPLHRRRLDFFRKNFRLSIDWPRRALGFAPRVDFATGAALTARWYRDEGYLPSPAVPVLAHQ